MGFYDDMAEVTKGVLDEFKQGVIQYIRVTPGAGPAHNPGPATETPFPVSGAMRGVKFKYVQDGLAIASDLQVTMPVDPAYEPAENGFVTGDGVRYKIVKILRKPAVGTAVAYTLIVRK